MTTLCMFGLAVEPLLFDLRMSDKCYCAICIACYSSDMTSIKHERVCQRIPENQLSGVNMLSHLLSMHRGMQAALRISLGVWPDLAG